MKIQLKILDKGLYSGCLLPDYATQGSAAIDLIATRDYTIYPGARVMIGTGLAIWIGSSTRSTAIVHNKESIGNMSIAGFIIPRSGLGTKGLVLANTIGLIDEDYQGELKISAWNSNKFIYDKELGQATNCRGEDLTIVLKAGDRIAQMYFAPVIKAQFDIVEEFTESTERGSGGFNSTGV